MSVRLSIGLLLLPLWATSCASGSDGQRVFGRVGEPCYPCRCGLGESPCDCDKCLDLAYDPVEEAILECDGSWKIFRRCPGGGSVVCLDGAAYDTTCLDAEGEPVSE